MTAADTCRRALALVGTRFRPQGRDPALGLDCVGLIAAVFQIPPESVPRDYQLRGDRRAEIVDAMSRYFRRVSPGNCRAGDVLLLDIAGRQSHLAIQTHSGIVHADAGIGRTVERPGEVPWKIVAVFRRRRRQAKGG